MFSSDTPVIIANVACSAHKYQMVKFYRQVPTYLFVDKDYQFSVADPDPHGSGTFPGSGIIVPGLDPAKNERADKKNFNFKFQVCEFCTVGLYYEIENARQLLDSSF